MQVTEIIKNVTENTSTIKVLEGSKRLHRAGAALSFGGTIMDEISYPGCYDGQGIFHTFAPAHLKHLKVSWNIIEKENEND